VNALTLGVADSRPSRRMLAAENRCRNRRSQRDSQRVAPVGARSSPFTRVAQRLLAMAAGIWDNWMTGVTSKRSLIAFDH